MNRQIGVRTVLLALTLAAAVAAALAGPLDPPPGPVAPTYKTLSEVEPRIAINAVNTPGDQSAAFIISGPGSYYLTGPLHVSDDRNGIRVNASDVTIDLSGFAVTCGTGFTRSAVTATTSPARLTVRNGSIIGWEDAVNMPASVMSRAEGLSVRNKTPNSKGIILGDRSSVLNCKVEASGTAIGVGAGSMVADCDVFSANEGVSSAGAGVTVERCRVAGVFTAAFRLGAAAIVSDCISLDSPTGFVVGDRSELRSCVVQNSSMRSVGYSFASDCALSDCRANNVSTGFSGGSGGTLEGCAAAAAGGTGFTLADSAALRGCTATGSVADGFVCGAGARLESCTARGNAGDGIRAGNGSTIVECLSTDNSRGIVLNNGGEVVRCATRNNRSDGISVNFSCTVTGNNCNGDGTAAPGSQGGIRVLGQSNRIDSNSVTYADVGLLVDAPGNFIIRNTLRGNGANISILVGNDVGPLGTAATATSPWANIAN